MPRNDEDTINDFYLIDEDGNVTKVSDDDSC